MQGGDYNDSYYYDNYTLPLATSWVQLFASFLLEISDWDPQLVHL